MSRLIAIIDDEPDIVELVSIHLKKAMFKVKGFSDAEGLYRFLGLSDGHCQESEQIPDLIILDLMLPDADGIEICKNLKKRRQIFFYSHHNAYGKGRRNRQNPGIGIWCR